MKIRYIRYAKSCQTWPRYLERWERMERQSYPKLQFRMKVNENQQPRMLHQFEGKIRSVATKCQCSFLAFLSCSIYQRCILAPCCAIATSNQAILQPLLSLEDFGRVYRPSFSCLSSLSYPSCFSSATELLTFSAKMRGKYATNSHNAGTTVSH